MQSYHMAVARSAGLTYQVPLPDENFNVVWSVRSFLTLSDIFFGYRVVYHIMKQYEYMTQRNKMRTVVGTQML